MFIMCVCSGGQSLKRKLCGHVYSVTDWSQGILTSECETQDNECVLARVHSSLQQAIFNKPSKLDTAPTIHHQTAADWISNETSIQTSLSVYYSSSIKLILGICN